MDRSSLVILNEFLAGEGRESTWMEAPGSKCVRRIKAGCTCILLSLLSGCGWVIQISQSARLRGYDKDINRATQAIAKARDVVGRANAYSTRGSAYAEKARYSRGFKLISDDEYERLFGLAMKDHDQAIALDPNHAEAYYSRGKAYWDRGTAELAEHEEYKSSFDHAAADFETSTQKDPGNFMAFDMLGLSRESNGEWDEAIQVYTREQALNPKLGTARLADAYCGRGQFDQTKMNLEAATVDYEKSVELGAKTNDSCSCEPYNSLLAVYTETKQYDKAWNFVHLVEKSKHYLDRELVDQLRKASGRNG